MAGGFPKGPWVYYPRKNVSDQLLSQLELTLDQHFGFMDTANMDPEILADWSFKGLHSSAHMADVILVRARDRDRLQWPGVAVLFCRFDQDQMGLFATHIHIPDNNQQPSLVYNSDYVLEYAQGQESSMLLYLHHYLLTVMNCPPAWTRFDFSA